MTEQELFKVAQAADYCGVHPDTVRRALRAELLEAASNLGRGRGRGYRLRRAELDRWAAEGCPTGRAWSWGKAGASYVERSEAKGKERVRLEYMVFASSEEGAKFRGELFHRFGGRCARCLKVSGELELDHIVPIAKGGTNELSNFQPLCRSCNSSKRMTPGRYPLGFDQFALW